MKVVSWKTLLTAVVIGGGGIIYKIMYFDGLTDLFWIVLFGYLHSAAANGRWCGDQRPPCGLKTAR